ncbi:MAG: sigma-70 family RNA polymerase sigma factor [Lachnospiraceae bacterium]|nr:sigma-70 family RNA polymerase sigma factor [Lachnospiraceae bacterium]
MLQYLLLLETEEEKKFFKSIYEEHKNEMFHVAVGILKNESDAEDMVHETFLTLVDHLDKLINNKPYKVWSYINITLKHKCYNLCKRKMIQEDIGLEDWQSWDVFEKSVDKLVEEKELKEVMAELVDQLKYPYREVLILQYYHDIPVQKIAKEMGTTPDNIRHISMRAKKKLQDVLEREGFWERKKLQGRA